MKIKLILIITSIACLVSCSKDEDTEQIDAEDPSKVVYNDALCSIRDMFWTDNDNILIFDDCAKLKKINVVTRKVQEIAFILDYHLLPQTNYFFNKIPDYFYYTAATPRNDGGYGDPINLYRLDLSTKENILVTDSLPNPLWGGYTSGSQHLAVPQPMNDTIMVIDLQSFEIQELDLNGIFTGFSPDDNQAVIYLYESGIYSIYDFDSNTFQDVTLYGAGTPLWREEGLFSASVIRMSMDYSDIFPFNLLFQKMTSGELLCTLKKMMEWGVSPDGTLTASFVADPDYETSFKASLVTFDLQTLVKTSLVTVKYNWLFNTGYINHITVSPDEKKIVFVYNFNEIKMVEVK